MLMRLLLLLTSAFLILEAGHAWPERIMVWDDRQD